VTVFSCNMRRPITMRRYWCFIVLLTVSSFSSVGFVIRIMLKNVQRVTVVGGYTLGNKDGHRNNCISDSFGIPSSLVESGCVGDSCRKITCDKLFAGDHAAIEAAQNVQRKSLSDDEVHKLASDCNRLRHLGEYQMTPVRAADEELPIAFTILVHLNAEQFERLLRVIYRPQNVYCVHVDTKSSKSFQSAVKAVVYCFHNVYIATRLHHVVYAGPSRLQVCGNVVNIATSYT